MPFLLYFILRQDLKSPKKPILDNTATFDESGNKKSSGIDIKSNSLNSIPTAVATPTESQKIMEFLKSESGRVGQTDSDPKATEVRLFQFAKTLTESDFLTLKTVALDRQLSGDERYLSAYLLAQNKTPQVQSTLLAVASAPLPNEKMDDRLYDQEVIIRTEALEGLAHIEDKALARQHLLDYIKHQENVSLIEHARRLLYELEKR